MRFKLLGNSGLRVSELCLGTMTFGNAYTGWGAAKEESRSVYQGFVEAGGNFFDTANIYQGGESEEFVGEFIGADRHRQIIATKFSLAGKGTDPNACGNQRKNIVQALEASLRRLKTDYVDLYWMHAWDRLTPQEEVLRALDDLVRSGKILYTGISDTPAWVVSRSQAIAELRGWTAFAALQLPYSLVERTPERELLPMAEALGISVTVWGGLGNGLLSGKYRGAATDNANTGRLNDPTFAAFKPSDQKRIIAETLVGIADEIGATAPQTALAWLRARYAFIIPILGARTAAQLQDNLGCLNVALSAEHLSRLDAVSAIDLGFPTDFLDSVGMQSLAHRNQFPLIDVTLPATRK